MEPAVALDVDEPRAQPRRAFAALRLDRQQREGLGVGRGSGVAAGSGTDDAVEETGTGLGVGGAGSSRSEVQATRPAPRIRHRTSAGRRRIVALTPAGPSRFRPILAAMPVLRSRLDPTSAEARANHDAMAALVAELRDRQAAVAGRGAGGDDRSDRPPSRARQAAGPRADRPPARPRLAPSSS